MPGYGTMNIVEMRPEQPGAIPDNKIKIFKKMNGFSPDHRIISEVKN